MYLLLKVIHIASVALFLGNITTGIFWKAHADATKNPTLQAHALLGIIRSDRYFTVPGVVAILASGMALAQIADLPILATPWIAVSLLAFAVSGLLFTVFIAPMQKRLFALAVDGASQSEWPSAAYRRLSLRWEVIGIIAILLPLAALALMVLKPSGFQLSEL
jgi:uncharacterized membrane protein